MIFDLKLLIYLFLPIVFDLMLPVLEAWKPEFQNELQRLTKVKQTVSNSAQISLDKAGTTGILISKLFFISFISIIKNLIVYLSYFSIAL